MLQDGGPSKKGKLVKEKDAGQCVSLLLFFIVGILSHNTITINLVLFIYVYIFVSCLYHRHTSSRDHISICITHVL